MCLTWMVTCWATSLGTTFQLPSLHPVPCLSPKWKVLMWAPKVLSQCTQWCSQKP